MRRSFYSRCEFTAPWGLELPAIPDSLMFHVVTSGRCWLEVEDEEPRLLQLGDLGLVPHGEGHRLVSEPGVPCAELMDPPGRKSATATRSSAWAEAARPRVSSAARSASTTRPREQLVSLLPRMISVEAWSSPEMEWIASTLRFMAAEAREPRPGARRSSPAWPTSW